MSGRSGDNNSADDASVVPVPTVTAAAAATVHIAAATATATAVPVPVDVAAAAATVHYDLESKAQAVLDAFTLDEDVSAVLRFFTYKERKVDDADFQSVKADDLPIVRACLRVADLMNSSTSKSIFKLNILQPAIGQKLAQTVYWCGRCKVKPGALGRTINHIVGHDRTTYPVSVVTPATPAAPVALAASIMDEEEKENAACASSSPSSSFGGGVDHAHRDKQGKRQRSLQSAELHTVHHEEGTSTSQSEFDFDSNLSGSNKKQRIDKQSRVASCRVTEPFALDLTATLSSNEALVVAAGEAGYADASAASAASAFTMTAPPANVGADVRLSLADVGALINAAIAPLCEQIAGMQEKTTELLQQMESQRVQIDARWTKRVDAITETNHILTNMLKQLEVQFSTSQQLAEEEKQAMVMEKLTQREEAATQIQVLTDLLRGHIAGAAGHIAAATAATTSPSTNTAISGAAAELTRFCSSTESTSTHSRLAKEIMSTSMSQTAPLSTTHSSTGTIDSSDVGPILPSLTVSRPQVTVSTATSITSLSQATVIPESTLMIQASAESTAPVELAATSHAIVEGAAAAKSTSTVVVATSHRPSMTSTLTESTPDVHEYFEAAVTRLKEDDSW